MLAMRHISDGARDAFSGVVKRAPVTPEARRTTQPQVSSERESRSLIISLRITHTLVHQSHVTPRTIQRGARLFPRLSRAGLQNLPNQPGVLLKGLAFLPRPP